jgi:hypothetical protein
MGEKSDLHGISEERDHLEDQSIEWKIIVKWILNNIG